ncbi:MAG TPA: N,N-dimethylformamidase beta subunit family domain-containing protein [Jatrophihabitans sp.]|nr:N,N-dimethylformamidase beta subunit family domain-containing protein [Jatrophihabitans sp.]
MPASLPAAQPPRSLPPAAGSAPGASGAPAAPPNDAGSDWRIPRGAGGGIAGYTDPASVVTGGTVTLYASTRAPTFVVRAFRMGWYGGSEARQTWRSQPVSGRVQPAPVLPPAATNTVTTLWRPSLRIDTTGWLPGVYLLRLDAADGSESYVPLTVRSPSAAGKVVIISPVTTWQAYNTWGCCDLYAGGNGSFATRARAVSFDRPYAMERGAGEFIRGELGLIAEAERLRLPLDFVTDVDLQTVPDLLAGARAVVSPSHDEYWSPRMRAVLTAARDAGTNLAFLGANAIYRRIRFAPTALGPDRVEINYKIAQQDPLYGRDDPAVTADWPAAPDPRPESALLGAQYGCLTQTPHAPGVVADPGAWLFAGAHVYAGQMLPGLIGPEIDAVQPAYPTPRPIEVLLHSPVSCPAGAPAAADTTYYVAPSGAGVFDAGTIAWACAVSRRCPVPMSGPTHRVVRTVTDNLLSAFAQGPAGRLHPARDNLVALGIVPR